MKTALLLALLVFSPSASGQSTSGPKDPPSSNDVIRADRAKADAREAADPKTRPWDRDADGKRPWDRKETPSPKQ